jgi:archaellum component FlaF (FlaF/FlaG flagellin family)
MHVIPPPAAWPSDRRTLILVVDLVLCIALRAVSGGSIERISVGSDGTQANAECYVSPMSVDGRFVTFSSAADNLVPGDTNGVRDGFVHDRISRATERVSISSAGAQANAASGAGGISGNGRFVVVSSAADNLVPGDTNGKIDVFVRDRFGSTTERVSIASDGSEANGHSYAATLSADGRYVAFYSMADNLVPGDTNGAPDIFVHDRETGETTRVSVASDGSEANGESRLPAISADGRFVAFSSDATNLVASDTNGRPDVFLHDRQTGATECVSLAVTVTCEPPRVPSVAISGDGRVLAFILHSEDWYGPCPGSGLYIHDQQTGETILALSEYRSPTLGGYPFENVAVSEDGRYVAFDEEGCGGIPGSTYCGSGINLYDTVAQWTSSLVGAWMQSDYLTKRYSSPAISGDGRCVAFSSTDPDLVPEDTNGAQDVFVLDRFPEDAPPETQIVSGPCEEAVLCPEATTICWTGTDDKTPTQSLQYYWRLDGGAWQGPTSQTCASLPPLAHDIHVFEVRAVDEAGNVDPSPAECGLSVFDGFPPSVSISSPANEATVRGVVNITANTSDSSGIQRVEFYARGQLRCTLTRPPYSCAWDTPAVPDGPAEICAKAFDSCGHSAQACITVTVDNTTFDDVAKTDSIWSYVEALAAAGVTAGCSASPPLFCPYGKITRAQMAKFVCLAAAKTWLDRATPTFADVPKGHPFYGWIERLTDAASWGGTPPAAGCEFVPKRKFCPGGAVTREYLAMVLCLATGKPQMPSYSGAFADVPRTNPFARFIERMADAASWPGGIAVTGGCATNPLRYCPKSAVTRGPMAVFIVRAFGIPM